MTTLGESTPIEPEAELIGAQDQPGSHLPDDAYGVGGDNETGEDEAQRNREEDPPA